MDPSSKIGFVLNKIDISDRSIQTIKLIEKLAKANSVYLFYNDLPEISVNNTNYFILHARELFNFDGSLYSTCEYTTKQVLNNFRSKKRYYIISELEWVINKNRKFDDWQDCYLHPDINLITVSADYRNIITNTWQKEVRLIDEFF